jgi:hypothetical protein
MLPKYHLILGIIFSLLLYWLLSLTIFQTLLIFSASFFIDLDHYLWYVNRKKDISLKNAYKYLKKISMKGKKPIMMLFHTIEFHIFIGLLGFIWIGFSYILIGMIFHSFSDLLYFGKKNMLYIREFSLIRYFILKNKYPKKYF